MERWYLAEQFYFHSFVLLMGVCRRIGRDRCANNISVLFFNSVRGHFLWPNVIFRRKCAMSHYYYNKVQAHQHFYLKIEHFITASVMLLMFTVQNVYFQTKRQACAVGSLLFWNNWYHSHKMNIYSYLLAKNGLDWWILTSHWVPSSVFVRIGLAMNDLWNFTWSHASYASHTN